MILDDAISRFEQAAKINEISIKLETDRAEIEQCKRNAKSYRYLVDCLKETKTLKENIDKAIFKITEVYHDNQNKDLQFCAGLSCALSILDDYLRGDRK